MVMTRRLLGRHKHCRSASRNHLGSTKSNCSYAIHALESPQDCRPARPPAPQQVPEESQPPGSGPGRRSERRDASLTPAACLPQQAKTSRRGWAGPPATHWPHVLGRRRLPSSAPATSAGQGAGHSQAAVRPEGQMRRHGACRTPSRAQTPWSAGPAHPRKAGQGLSLSRWQGPLPDHCSGLTSLDPPWSPCPLAPQLSVLRRGDTGQGRLCQADGTVCLTHADAGNKEAARASPRKLIAKGSFSAAPKPHGRRGVPDGQAPSSVSSAVSEAGRGHTHVSPFPASGGGQRQLRPAVLMEMEADRRGRVSDRLFQEKTADA